MLTRLFSLSLLSCILSVLTIPHSLNAQTIYWKKDYIRDSSGSTIAVATPAPSNTEAPTDPGTPSATAAATSVALSWGVSTDNSTSGYAAGYIVYRGAIPVAAVSGLTFTDVGLLPTTAYSYRIVAFDDAQNYSGYSTAVNATTLAQYLPPRDLIATASSTTQINLTWSVPLSGAPHHYGVWRRSNSSWTKIDTTTSLNYSDTVSAATSYVYKVSAEKSDNTFDGYTNLDLATTILFTDSTITVASTLVKAVHITELRTAVNAVRTAAGLSSSSWTNSSLSGAWIQAVDITELRSSLGAALSALGLSAPSYTDSTPTGGTTTIKKAHVEELRQGVK